MTSGGRNFNDFPDNQLTKCRQFKEYSERRILLFKAKFFMLLWLPCVADANIIFLSCFFFLPSSSLPHLISAVADWMSTILPHMVWPECEFRMQVWNVQHAARWNTGRKNRQKLAISAP